MKEPFLLQVGFGKCFIIAIDKQARTLTYLIWNVGWEDLTDMSLGSITEISIVIGPIVFLEGKNLCREKKLSIRIHGFIYIKLNQFVGEVRSKHFLNYSCLGLYLKNILH